MTHCLYERAAKFLARLRGCAGSPEPWLYQIRLMRSICEKNDILLLKESWPSDVSIDGFERIILNRTEKKLGMRRNSGGLIVYIKSCLFDENIFVKCDGDDIIWFKLKNNVISDKPVF